MKSTITKLVSIDYDGPEERARAYEQFHLFGSTEGVVIRNVRPYMSYGFFKVMRVFRKRKKKSALQR